MANLKNKLLQALQNGKNLETILNDLSKSQKNLLRNHSNPVFNNKDKNKILKQYTNLQNIGKSLYRYNSLNENNLESDSERTDIENIVLKGGISYNKYIWHSENSENTCDVCKSLDGKEFDFYDEVPERPHPNWKCTVEVVEENESKPQTSNDYEKPCDTIDEIETMISDMEELNPIVAFLNTLRIFISNYVELLYHAYRLNEHEMDKYYHSKANCEATQEMGIIGEQSATLLSNLKEKYDQYTYVYTHKATVEEAIADSERDQVANRLGRERGRKYPYCDCSILMNDLLPDYKK